MDRRRYSTMLVLAAAALLAEACSSSNGNKGTGGTDGGSTGGVTGTGGKATGGVTGTAGVTGTGGKTDSGTDTGTTGTGGKVDSGTDTGTTGTGGKVDSGIDTPTDTPVMTDATVDADPAASEKALCATAAYMNTSAPPFTALQFCTLYREICNNDVGATNFPTEAACEAAYNGYSTDPDAGGSGGPNEGPNGQKGCRTYHLCNANQISLTIHCPHATGFGNNDAAGGPCP